MKTITVAELRQNPSPMLEDVESGVTFVITRHNRPVGQITPVPEAPGVQLLPPKKSGGTSLSGRPRRRLKSAKSLDELLDWVKGDH